ncbi:glycosyltransferase family 4 protein [Persicitalea sp.]|uniref:glycosyltransferase family 4 protein n=1 Tax=Persicitalea sp. TaxID=3100273 RepID=UPI003593E96C
MKILLLRDRFSHMGQHSGYDQLSDALLKADAHEYSSIWRPSKPSSSRFLGKIRNRYRDNIHATTFYNLSSLQHELAAAWETYRKPKEVIHILYLEDTLGFLPKLRQQFFKKTKLVATAHQPPSWWKINRLEPHWLDALDALIVLDSASKEFMTKYLAAEKIHIIPHGVDTRFFSPQPDVVVSEPIRCLFVGQWLRDFGAFERIVDQLSETKPKIQFDMVYMRNATDVQNPRMMRLARNPNVHFHTKLTDNQLLKCYRKASLLVLPLLDSTANNAILEAMATGTPILTSAVGGVPDYLPQNHKMYIRQGKQGLCTEALHYLKSYPAEKNIIGKVLREKAEREFDWAVIANRTADLYRKVTLEI